MSDNRLDRRSQPVPMFVGEEVTGVYHGAELHERRGKRGTEERFERLEGKHDSLVNTVTETRVIVGKLSGQLKVILLLLTALLGHALQQLLKL